MMLLTRRQRASLDPAQAPSTKASLSGTRPALGDSTWVQVLGRQNSASVGSLSQTRCSGHQTSALVGNLADAAAQLVCHQPPLVDWDCPMISDRALKII